jgi:hypothetical protein
MRRKRVSVVPVVRITYSYDKKSLFGQKALLSVIISTAVKEKKKAGGKDCGRVDRQERDSGGGGVVEVVSFLSASN